VSPGDLVRCNRDLHSVYARGPTGPGGCYELRQRGFAARSEVGLVVEVGNGLSLFLLPSHGLVWSYEAGWTKVSAAPEAPRCQGRTQR